MSKSEQRERERALIDEARHAHANIPMSLPKDAYEVVPGIYVAAFKALPQLIEFFNVRTVVRCMERPATTEADFLINLGGNAQHPYGDVIDDTHIFHAPLRDSVEETEFPALASKAAAFIKNVLATEEQEAEAEHHQKHNNEVRDDDEKVEQGGDKEGEATKENEKNGAAAAAAAEKKGEEDETNTKSAEAVARKQEEEEDEAGASPDPFAAFRTRGPGNIVLHCEAGRSRSPAIAIAYLIQHRQMNLQEALELFDGDEDTKPYKLQINPVFMMHLCELEQHVLGAPVFDIKAYWVKQLRELFPQIPASTIASQLDGARGNMLAARDQLMTMAARQFFDRDKLMIDALVSICAQTTEDWRASSNMRWDSKDPVVSREEIEAAYRDSGKKRDVALANLTKTIRSRMTIVTN